MANSPPNRSEARKLVRRFSPQLYQEDPNNELAESLAVVTVETLPVQHREPTLEEQWEALFDPIFDNESSNVSNSPEDLLLETKGRNLAKAYREFVKTLPEGHGFKIEDGPPSLGAVLQAATTVNTKLESDRGKTKTGQFKGFFHKVCGSMDGHQDLFAIIPSGDKYVCLLTGSISALVKASIRHEDIASAVSNALDDLSDDIGYWRRALEIHGGNIHVREYTAKLYMVVFDFLARIMTQWSSRSSLTRAFKSFDSKFLKTEIEEKRIKIKDLEHKLERESRLSIERSIMENPTKDDIANLILTGQARFQAQLFKELGRTVRGALEDVAQEFLQEFYQTRMQSLTNAIGSAPHPSIKAQEKVVYSKKNIQLDAEQFLGQYRLDDNIDSLIDQSSGLEVHVEIFSRVRDWNAAKTSQALWIQGPFQASIPSRYTLLSAYAVRIARRASVPVIAYFCRLGAGPLGFTNMLYSLTLQVVDLLPNTFTSKLDFSAARFKHLDGTRDSLPAAISVFQDLIGVGPPILFCIIDGLQFLESRENKALLTEFVEILHSAGRSIDSEARQVVKTLFTTDGFPNALTILKGKERLETMDFTSEYGAGQAGDRVGMSFF